MEAFWIWRTKVFQILFLHHFSPLLPSKWLFNPKLLWTILIYKACLWSHLGRNLTERLSAVLHKFILHQTLSWERTFPLGEFTASKCLTWFPGTSPFDPSNPKPVHSSMTRTVPWFPFIFSNHMMGPHWNCPFWGCFLFRVHLQNLNTTHQTQLLIQCLHISHSWA